VTPLGRAQRLAVALWLVLAVALWNGVFEMIVVRGVKEYLFRAALFDAGRGPLTPIPQIMDPAIRHATWVATLWASVVMLAAMTTIRWLSPGTGEDKEKQEKLSTPKDQLRTSNVATRHAPVDS
jgi:hypothetical protein